MDKWNSYMEMDNIFEISAQKLAKNNVSRPLHKNCVEQKRNLHAAWMLYQKYNITTIYKITSLFAVIDSLTEVYAKVIL